MINQFELVKLPYQYDALEPSINEKTMLVHIVDNPKDSQFYSPFNFLVR